MRLLRRVGGAAKKLVSDAPDLPDVVRKGRLESMRGEGMQSLFAMPAVGLAKKLKGADRVEDAVYRYYQRPLKNVDERAGRFLAREISPRLFRQIDVLPTGRKMDGVPALLQHETASATAPLSKAVKVVSPIAASMYAWELMDKMKNKDEGREKAASLLKQAADAIDLAEKREAATKLAFALVERGKERPYESYEEFEAKVASLINKDLRVVGEAIELESPLTDFGKLASGSTSPKGVDGATEKFFHTLAD